MVRDSTVDRTLPQLRSPLLAFARYIEDACLAEERRTIEDSSVPDEPDGLVELVVVATGMCGFVKARWERLGADVAGEWAAFDAVEK